jgi:hypothetical protein
MAKKPTSETKTTLDEVNAEKDAAAILDERETLRQLFTPAYSPQIGVFADGKVEVMLKLTENGFRSATISRPL